MLMCDAMHRSALPVHLLPTGIPSDVDARDSVLFLGSGFSRSATNILGENLPTGRELHRSFAKLLDLSPDTYSIRTLADEIASRPNLDLYQLLYDTFIVRQIDRDQEAILALPWNRVYTTNYDDAAEFAYRRNGKPIHSFDFNEPKPEKLPPGAIVHLHGLVRSTSHDNVLDQVVLNETSYVRQHLAQSPWYPDFIRDVTFCMSCFFIGYNLDDHHISALLIEIPNVDEKTYFVTQQPVDPIFSRRVKRYGVTLPIDVAGFAIFCRHWSPPAIQTSPYAIKGFLYLDPLRDKRTRSAPTANEILNLVTYGTFNQRRCFENLPSSDYVVSRSELADAASKKLNDVKCLLIHSRIGNGKSIFLYILAHRMTQQGYRCFLARENAPLLQRDVRIIDEFKNVILFFDSYNQAVEFIPQIAGHNDQVKIVVSVRTSVQEVRMHEIQQRLPAPHDRIDLNGISKQERLSFDNLLLQAGAGTRDLHGLMSRSRDFRDIVLGAYRNRLIQKKIQQELAPLLIDSRFRSVFVVTHLLKWIGQDVDIAFIRSVTECDAYAELARVREHSGDIFALDADVISVRSSVFAEHIIQNHLSTVDITNGIYSILVQAVRQKTERRFQAVVSSLMTISKMSRAIQHDSDKIVSLCDLFERRRLDDAVNREPLFWLQYSILKTQARDLRTAESFIRNAYLRADESPGFRTFQIDTYALRLFLMIETDEDPTLSVVRFEDIIDKLDKIRTMIGDESIRLHAIQVLKDVEPFVASRVSSLSAGERITLVRHIHLLTHRLDDISSAESAATGALESRKCLSGALKKILEFENRIR